MRFRVSTVRTVRSLIVLSLLTVGLTPVVIASTAQPANAAIACSGTNKTWTPVSGNDWTTAANWSGGTLPTGGSNVCIPAGTDVEVTSAGAGTANSITVEDGATLTITDQTLTLGNSSDIADLTLNGTAHLAKANVMNVTTLTWNGGSITGSGGMTVTGDATITGPDAKSETLINTGFQGLVTYDTTAPLSGGSTTFYLGNTAQFELRNNATFNTSAIINLGGTMLATGGGSPTITGAFVNSGSGLLSVADGNSLTVDDIVNDNGEVRVDGSNASLTMTAAHTLTQKGRVAVLHDATLQLGSAPYSQVNPGGVQTVGLTLDGVLSSSGATISYGTASLAGTVASDLALSISASIAQSGVGRLEVGGSFTQTAGTLGLEFPNAGTQGTAYDSVVITGNATISGSSVLAIDATGYAAQVNDTFKAIDVAGTMTGTYPTVNVSNLAAGQQLDVSQSATGVTFSPATGTIAGHIYTDANGDGTLQGSETTGENGRTVFLDTNSNGSLDPGETSTTTDANGAYHFTIAISGSYKVDVQTPAGAAQTVEAPAVAATLNGTTAVGSMALFTKGLATAQVFGDVNLNGAKDSGETGVSDVRIYLDTNDNGSFDNSEPNETTANDGVVMFDGLDVGTYKVRAVVPSGRTQTTANVADVVVATSGYESPVNLIGFATIPHDAASEGTGYLMIGSTGTLYTFGDAQDQGSPAELPKLNAPIVDIAATPTGSGYWVAGADGGVFAYGDAGFFGSAGSLKLNKPVTGITPAIDSEGYWLVATDGGVFAYGSSTFYGSKGGEHLNSPAVSIVSTPSGAGYWIIAADGGVFTYGDATFHGSMGGTKITAPIVGGARTVDGKGYWLVGADGAVYAFGNATFHGSANDKKLASPIVAMRAKTDGTGYYLIAADGGVFTFGSATFFGTPTTKPSNDVVG